MKSVRGTPAMCRRIRQRIDDLQLLDDRAGPPVGDDQRQCIFMVRANVDEMDVDPVDLGDELRQGLQPRLARAPVVLCLPVARECLDRRQLHALGLIVDGLLPGPARGRDARTQLLQVRLGGLECERTDRGGVRLRFGHVSHVPLLSWGLVTSRSLSLPRVSRAREDPGLFSSGSPPKIAQGLDQGFASSGCWRPRAG